ncbi:MAG: DAHL domain-containing protein [Myxococcota bacterium]|nr:DAHL domain-containing protein [Myxococcota bacterium]
MTRSSRTLGLAALLTAVALLAALASARAAEVDLDAHEAYARALRRTQELDARMDEEVARSRLRLVTHYDDLVRVWDETSENRAALERPPPHLDAELRARLMTAVTRYGETLDEKRALVERFKSDQAVLRNAMRALPRNVARRSEALRQAGDPGAAEELDALLRAVLLAVVAPSDAHVHAARGALARTPPSEALVAPHARLVLERTERLEQTVGRVMTLPVSQRAEAVREVYGVAHAAATDRAEARWLLVYAFGLGLLALGAGYIIVRMSEAAAALRDTKAKLEVALTEIELERDREAELARLKSRFVSMTSHEFRTPLSVILSSAELFEAYGERWDRAKRATHLDRIQGSAKAMSRMLDDVLLIGRAESGMLELKARPLSLPALIDSVVEEVRAVVGPERALEITRRGTEAERVWLDDKLLRHVLTNLLSNAFKYSPDESAVDLLVETDAEGVRLEVRDRGIGIPEADRAHLFEAFHRGSNASRIPGTGLGLAVVQRSVEVHRGTLEVESEEGRGTTFRVRVPFVEGET